MTPKQRETLTWLVGPRDTPFEVNGRVWNNLLAKGYVTLRAGHLCVTRAGREALSRFRTKRATCPGG